MNTKPIPTASHLLRMFGVLFCFSLPTAALLAFVDTNVHVKGDPIGAVLWLGVAFVPALFGGAAYVFALRRPKMARLAVHIALGTTTLTLAAVSSASVVWIITDAL